jgi:uncharacterized protein
VSVFYVHTSAVIKLLVDETHTSAMAAFYDEHEDWDWASSALLRIEVARAISRVQSALLPDARELLDFFSYIPVDDDIVERAMIEPDPGLRSLDAIHLATARLLADDLASLVSYDERLLAATSNAGLPVVSPTGWSR